MSSSGYEGVEGVIGRKLLFCERLQELETDKLIKTCQDCHHFFALCCPCEIKYYDNEGHTCHHYRLVFTDGACRQNGQVGATAGIGIALSRDRSEGQLAIPITLSLDGNRKRTSQRAELLAALAGLQYMVDCDDLNEPKREKKRARRANSEDEGKAWVIATDSEYVVKGMTEWLPTWKSNGLRTNRNTEPSNLDLFLKLDQALAVEEAKQDVKIGFWHVPRAYNTIADGLAKEASLRGDLE